MKHKNRLAKQVTAWLLLGLFGMDSVLAATAPILPDTNAPASRQPLVPVSYTHLDVYKRQLYLFVCW